MLKDIRRKVIQIANRLVRQGQIRRNAMLTAWKIIRYKALRIKINGTSFDNRQNALQLLCKYNPVDITAKLVRDRLNTFDRNAIAVTAAVKGKVSAVIGYLPKAVACVELESYGARILVKIQFWTILSKLKPESEFVPE